jgi:A/G-specific adenine glycosylase
LSVSPENPSLFEPITFNVDEFARKLLAWHDEHGRHDLPWQRDVTPYSVWISEIMLQQTQVATVIPYFERFLARFPTVHDLATSLRDEVLAHWAGLGYYARARNVHAAAGIILADHDGVLPDSMTSLASLPGIGRSTAGAILAIAYGQRQAILDGNVKRVLARYHAVAGWPGRSQVLRELWALAESHTPRQRVADYTQGIMDLGATVCVRSGPGCEACPLNRGCAAYAAGTQQRLPTRKPRAKRPQRSVSVLLVRDEKRRVLLERRPDAGIWGGLFSLPELGTDEDADYWCDRYLGAQVSKSRSMMPIDHAFTHFDLRIEPIALELQGAPRNVMDGTERLWYKPADEMDFGVAAPIYALLSSLQ